MRVSEFSVLEFEYIQTNIPVNPIDSSSLANAIFTGKLSYPPFTLTGAYNTSSGTVVFRKQLDVPFGGLNLSYIAEVDLVISQIVKRSFRGSLLRPVVIYVAGNFNSLECLLDLAGEVEVHSEEISAIASVTLEFCGNCSRICAARAVSLSVTLRQPWNISLNGTYMLSDNSTTVLVGGAVDIQTLHIEVSTTVQRNVSRLSLQDLILVAHLPEPIGVFIEGRYSETTEVATFSGSLRIQQIHFLLHLTVNVASKMLSDLTFCGNLTSPFFVTLFGSYKLNSNMSNLNLVGMLNIGNGFLQLSLAMQLDLSSHTILHYDFVGMVSEPLAVMVRAHYGSMLPSNNLELNGTIDLQNHAHALAVHTLLNTSTSPISLTSIRVSGVFPPPLDFITLSGLYMRHCSCAFISGMTLRDDFNLTASTNLIFLEGQNPSINQLAIQIFFHRPLNLFMRGQYMYTGPNSSLIVVDGTFNLTQIILSTELLLVINGISSLTVAHLHFEGTFPFPLNLEVQGDYNFSSSAVCLSGEVQYSFAELSASTKYLFVDDVHNMSSGLRDLQVMGTLTTPFFLNVQGLYTFETEMFSLVGFLHINPYLTLSVSVSVDTSSNPISVDAVTFNGTLMTPIPFESEFEGNFEFQRNMATLNSNLRIGSTLLSAKAFLLLQGNSSFELASITVSGSLPSPLSLTVTGTYIPGNFTDLYLAGNLNVGPILLVGMAHAQKDPVSQEVVLRVVSFRGTISNPFTMIMEGNYTTGNSLTLSSSVDLDVLYLVASTRINLTATSRTIETIDFLAQLKDPLNGDVTAVYAQSSGELILRGVIHLSSLEFSVEVYFNTTPQVHVRLVLLTCFFHPLSLKLVGIYNRDEQQIDLIGTISISSPELNITAGTSLDLSQETSTLSTLTLTAEFEQPPLILSGTYISSEEVLLTGILHLGNLQFTACALLHLRDDPSLDTVVFNISYTIPFNQNLQFQLFGAYNSTTTLLVLEGRIAEGSMKRRSIDYFQTSPVKQIAKRVASLPTQEGFVYCLLIVSTETSSVQVVSVNIPEIDVGSLLNTYLGIPWPNNFFPLNFRDIAIYRAYTSLTYRGILYREGYHARGIVKIFILPEIIIDATMVTEPQRVFQVSFNLRNTIDWRLFAICGSSDPTCSIMGPRLTIKVDSRNTRQFTISGGFKLFQIYIGTINITVKEERMEACIALSDDVKQLFLNLLPSSVKVFWNDTSFHTSLSIPGLMFPDFSLNNVASPDICAAIGGVISHFAIDAPFHLQTQLLAKRAEDGTLLFGAVLSGYVDLQIAGQSAVTVNIRPIYFVVNIRIDQPLTWNLFIDMIKQAIKGAAGDIVDGIRQNSEAYATLLGANKIQEATGKAAETLCESVLDLAGTTAVAGISTNVAAVTVGVLTATSVVGRDIVCGIAEILGDNCSGDDSDGDSDGDVDGGGDGRTNVTLTDILQQVSCSNNNGGCQQNCTQEGLLVRCSCSDGYFLHANGRSCISKLNYEAMFTFSTS